MTHPPTLFISNRWKAASGQLFSSHDPATGAPLWEGRSASFVDVDAAVHSAHAAFAQWSSLSVEERTPFLMRYTELLSSSQNTLAEIISKETGKPLWDALNEVGAMINKTAISLDAYHARCATLTHDQQQGRLITRHRPHGVVAVLGPYNFPAHLPNGHIIPALLAGNTVVFKPSEFTPLVAEEMIRLWEKAELPPGVLNLIQGGRDTGGALIHHPLLRGLFFTGSYATGLYLSQLFGSDPSKILALELGGNNPLVIGSLSNPEAAAYMIAQSAYLTSGQRCTCARRLILSNTHNDEAVLTALIKIIRSLSVGPYTQRPEPFMGPVITQGHAKQLLDAQARLKSLGGKILIEMSLKHEQSAFIFPGLIDVTGIKNRPDEEYFGPLLQVIRVADLDEAISEANNTRFGLAAGLLSDEQSEYDRFLQSAQAGIVNWNVPLTGSSSAAPFGGIKGSGNHRPSAYYAADYCSYPVASKEQNELKMPGTLLPGIKPWN